MTDARSRRLRFWLWLMAGCEQLGIAESPLYYRLVRRAASCNRWRT